MAHEHKKTTKTEFAMALAGGTSPADWARDHNISRMTAYRWAKEPEIRKLVEGFRQQWIDDALGIMSEQSTMAAKAIADLVERTASDSVRLRAARLILLDMNTNSRCSGLDRRLSEIEEKLEAQPQEQSGGAWSPESTPSYGLAVGSAAKPAGASIIRNAG